jgi:hypothetical protein
MAGAMASGTAVIPDDATCISLCLPGSNESPTLACQGCIDFADVLTLRPTAKRNKKNECKYPFEDKFRTDKEGAKRDTWAKINAYLLRAAANDVSSTQQNDEANDDESDAALNNDTLPDDVGDPQKQAPLCRQVSPDPARVIRDAVQSRVEESSPFAAAIGEEEDGDEYTIQDFADALSSSPTGRLPATPMRSPSPPKKKRNYTWGLHQEKVGNVVVQGIPNHYTLVRLQTLGCLYSDTEQLTKLKNTVSADKFSWGDTARWYIACGLSQIPRASFYALEQFIPCIIAALFMQAGITSISFEALANSMPSQATIKSIAFDGAAECLVIQRARLSKACAVMLGCDKGQRHGIDHLPKCLSYFNLEDDRVESFCLDNDPTGGTSDSTAHAVAHSLNTKLGREVLQFLYAQSTDSGGGGTLYSLKEGLLTLNWVSDYLYFVLPCTIHAWQRALQNAMEGVFGLGGLGSRNLLQLVHSCYDLQQCFPGLELSAMWRIALGEAGDEGSDRDTPNRMSAAVLTRWWYVNTAVVHLLENWDAWQEMAQTCRNANKSDTKVSKIASSSLSLMKEPKLRADAEFVKAISLSLFNPHLRWLQGYDEIAKDFGYRCRNMGERYYLITEHLNRLCDGGWREDPAFEEFLAASAKVQVIEDPESSETAEVARGDGRQFKFSPEDCGSSADTFFSLFQATCTKHLTHGEMITPSLCSQETRIVHLHSHIGRSREICQRPD